jgi:hypothetical protein
MANLTLNLDKKAEKMIELLKVHYGATSKAEVIRKALALLQVVSEMEANQGELIARKGNRETRILVR